jgi:hypothetical protein
MRRSYDEALDFWRARDAYRVQTTWMALCGMAFGLPCVLMLTTGHWVVALGLVGMWWLVEWALPRGLRWLFWQMQDGARWAGRWSLGKLWRWWHGLVLVVVLGGLLAGCQGIDGWIASLHGFHGDPVTGVCMPKDTAPPSQTVTHAPREDS